MRWFWLFWISTTAAGGDLRSVGGSATDSLQLPNNNETPDQGHSNVAADGDPGTFAVATLLVVFLVCYIALILAWDDFAYFDNEYFTLGPLRGHNIALAISQRLDASFRWVFRNLISHVTLQIQ